MRLSNAKYRRYVYTREIDEGPETILVVFRKSLKHFQVTSSRLLLLVHGLARVCGRSNGA